MVKKTIFYLVMVLCLCLTTVGYAIEIDTDSNDAVDIAYGGTNANDVATARSNLNVVPGTHVQAYDAELAALAGLTSAADKFPYFTGSGTATVGDVTTFARSILDDADEATFKATVNLESGTDVQAYHAYLADIVAITGQKGDMLYFDGTDWVELDANDSDLQNYILSLSGANPDSVPAWVNTFTITEFTIPNDANPTTDDEGDMAWDSDDDMLEVYDGANSPIIATAIKCSDPACFYEPDELDASTEPGGGVYKVKEFPSYQFPGGFTITAIVVETSATCTDAINMEEWSNNGTAWSEESTVDAITLSGVSTTETTITDASIAVGNSVMVDFAATMTDIDWLCITLCGRINDND